MKKLLYLILPLIFLTSLVSFAESSEWSNKDWSVENRVGRIFYITNGQTIAGHEFGLFKDPQDCKDDTLWLSLSSSNERVKDFEGKEVEFMLNIDGKHFRIKIPMLSSNTGGSYQIMMFTNISPEKQLMDSLMNGRNVKVKVVGPKEFEALMDIKEDTFSLNGFIASRLKANEFCKEASKKMLLPAL